MTQRAADAYAQSSDPYVKVLSDTSSEIAAWYDQVLPILQAAGVGAGGVYAEFELLNEIGTAAKNVNAKLEQGLPTDYEIRELIHSLAGTAEFARNRFDVLRTLDDVREQFVGHVKDLLFEALPHIAQIYASRAHVRVELPLAVQKQLAPTNAVQPSQQPAQATPASWRENAPLPLSTAAREKLGALRGPEEDFYYYYYY